MESLLGIPVSTTYTPLTPEPVLVDGTVVPIIPAKPFQLSMPFK